MPAVPAPSGRSAAPSAESTPSIAIALASIGHRSISARTTAIRQAEKGGEQERARRVREPSPLGGVTRNGQPNIDEAERSTRGRRAPVRVRTGCAGSRHRRRSCAAALRRPRATVSHAAAAGSSRPAGANAATSTTTSAVGPSATTSPSASTTTRSAHPRRARRRGSRRRWRGRRRRGRVTIVDEPLLGVGSRGRGSARRAGALPAPP